MIFMVCIYFSGTGNTRHLSDKLASLCSCQSVSIEDGTALMKIAENKTIILCYPVYTGGSPLIMREFMEMASWKGKKVFLLVTCGMFTGKAIANVAANLREKGADVLGGYSVKMPENIGDIPMFQVVLPHSRDKKVIAAAEKEITMLADKIRNHLFPQKGMSVLPAEEKAPPVRMTVDKDKCTGCGLCSRVCPYVEKFGTKCTLCYRCYANCPVQAITGLGNKVITQYKFPE
jgi:flavodoxin/NAD-dependent dihydropyrimidine dehydrogenase PreA subunit